MTAKSGKPGSFHRCAYIGCPKIIATSRFLCFDHWFPLPPPLKWGLTGSYKAWLRGEDDTLARLRLVQADVLKWWSEHGMPAGSPSNPANEVG